MKPNRKTVVTVIICCIVMVLYLALRIDTAWYIPRDGEPVGVRVFLLTNLVALRPRSGPAVTMDTIKLPTPYGGIVVDPFTEITFESRGFGSVVIVGIPKSKKVRNTVEIMGNRIHEEAGFSFYHLTTDEIDKDQDMLESLHTRQEIKIGEYAFKMRRIDFTLDKEREDMEFELYDFPEIITLSDGTEIYPKNSCDAALVVTKDMWKFTNLGDTLFIKKKEWDEPQEFKYIGFKPDWGDFIIAERNRTYRGDEWRIE